MPYRPTKATLRKLHAIALNQGGYFTAKQAAEIGYQYPHLDYHLRVGNFKRVGHGVYRLPEIPPSEQDDLVRLAFWSRDRNDSPQAVASHQTALAVHGLSDLLSPKIHLTVPTTFRKLAPKGTVLHRGKLEAVDLDEREGFSVTTPLRTILDVSADDSISEEHLQRAIAEALERGLVRKSKLTGIAKRLSAPNRLSRSLADLS
ncbi:MAG: type IV toxin-antitoxin system AbiEi family antitoxin domain-containing protein [Pirellulales bacterium]|nr:type IV toxin-antitoxin system AbiEi family antitoxin domain-containing protein [Pirellulales bacterium]